MLISVTGPECSGKTILTEFLKNSLDVRVVGEYAREYLEKKGGEYGIEDLDLIAQGQLRGMRDAGYGIRDAGYEIRDAGCWMLDSSDEMLDAPVQTEASGGDASPDRSVRRIRDWVITDTYLLVILIWSLDKFGRASDLLRELYTQNLPDYYLLCKPDLDWEYDKLRENQHGRNRLYAQYLEHIELSGVPYFVVEGKGEERMIQARKWVESLMQNKLP